MTVRTRSFALLFALIFVLVPSGGAWGRAAPVPKAPKPSLPSSEQLKEAKEAFAKLGGEHRERRLSGERGTVHTFSLPRTADDGVLRSVPNLPFAFGLNLSYTRVTDSGLKELERLTHLASLHLDCTDVSDQGLRELKALTNLTELNLRSIEVTDRGLAELKGLTNLSVLGLFGTDVTDAGLKELKGLTKLTSLELGSTKVTDRGLKELGGFTQLSVLGLFGTKVTDVGLAELKGLTNLAELNLRSTDVTDKGLKELRGLTHLTELNLRSTEGPHPPYRIEPPINERNGRGAQSARHRATSVQTHRGIVDRFTRTVETHYAHDFSMARVSRMACTTVPGSALWNAAARIGVHPRARTGKCGHATKLYPTMLCFR
ncbi:Putative regulatory subunit (Fragment) OS=Gemmata sp. Wa1-1 PE=4 SV=1: LRR_6: LRR_6 [Gemmata massiliana]|uniref:F-box/LRR-repeat protein 15-like leucin rich repeat domain-containing protein n=1 Tax=Gemmata massiliana TaxID=1210884 RepID=A0A6P2DLA7_9BACT